MVLHLLKTSEMSLNNTCRVQKLLALRKISQLASLRTSIQPELDLDFYLDERNKTSLVKNIANRKGIGDVNKVFSLKTELERSKNDPKKSETVKLELFKQILKLPNRTHPAVKDLINPADIKLINPVPQFSYTPLEFSEIARKLNLMRTDQLGHTCGPKSYYFIADLAEMEEALIRYSVNLLLEKGFQLYSVPDILPGYVLENCGMVLNTDRTQLYQLEPSFYGDNMYLSGTAEMALAGLLSGEILNADDLPMKLASVSRCFRAETSSVLEQRGIYRVHQFNKVEMFIVSTPETSDEILEYLKSTEEELFTPLDIHMRVLDMPPHELGAPAYRKYDVEAWMPGRDSFGEISSCSNCTDYQSRRLGIKYRTKNGEIRFAHTLNGTACAIPRMLIALLETHQKADGKIAIPKVLQPYMYGKEFIKKRKGIPELKLSKIKK